MITRTIVNQFVLTVESKLSSGAWTKSFSFVPVKSPKLDKMEKQSQGGNFTQWRSGSDCREAEQ